MDKKLIQESIGEWIEILELEKSEKYLLNHIENYQNNPDYKRCTDRLTFEEGRELTLKIKVKNSHLSTLLYTWLNTKNKNNESLNFFGCELKEIGWGKLRSKEEIKQEFLRMLDEME